MTVGAVPGVTILGGQATFGSSDGSMEVEGGPALGQVDLKVAGGPVLRTLSAIYAFGLTDDPDDLTDNLFAMPSGNLLFPGWDSRGGGGTAAAVVYQQVKEQIALASPPAYERIQLAANIGGSGGSGAGVFRWNELNDPNWTGNFNQLGFPWQVEIISFSGDDDPGVAHTATPYGARTYDPFAESPFIIPSGPRVGGGVRHYMTLYNQSRDQVLQVDQVSCYGQDQRLLLAKENGQNAQFVTHWNNEAAAPAAGDGPCWVVNGAGNFGGMAPRAAFGYQQTTASVDDAWQAAISLWDGAAWVPSVATWDTTLGQLLGRGGLQLPNVDSSTFPVSNAGSARLVWDDTLQKVMISVDATPYVVLSTFA